MKIFLRDLFPFQKRETAAVILIKFFVKWGYIGVYPTPTPNPIKAILIGNGIFPCLHKYKQGKLKEIINNKFLF